MKNESRQIQHNLTFWYLELYKNTETQIHRRLTGVCKCVQLYIFLNVIIHVLKYRNKYAEIIDKYKYLHLFICIYKIYNTEQSVRVASLLLCIPLCVYHHKAKVCFYWEEILNESWRRNNIPITVMKFWHCQEICW